MSNLSIYIPKGMPHPGTPRNRKIIITPIKIIKHVKKENTPDKKIPFPLDLNM
jgi:hypothetical protein